MATRDQSHRARTRYTGDHDGGGRGEALARGDESRTARPAEQGRDEETGGEPEKWGAAGGIVARYPYTTVLTSFGIGFGFGLFVTLLLTRREESWFERYAPESIQHLPDRLRRVPETVASYVPRSWRLW